MVQNHRQTEPRSWFSLFFEQLGWAALVLAFVCVLLTGASVAGYLGGSEFDRKGVLTEATVQSVRTNPRVSPSSRVVRFTYSVPEGRFSGSAVTGGWFVQRHPIGTTAEIYYLPDDPARVSVSARVDRGGLGPRFDAGFWDASQ
ncbi:MAG: DUF3592 domain-containing protein [Yoonia sp.]|nr:DUF3592 domain-containing protein [Yoonia sp.]